MNQEMDELETVLDEVISKAQDREQVLSAATLIVLIMILCTAMMCATLFLTAREFQPQITYQINDYKLEKGK